MANEITFSPLDQERHFASDVAVAEHKGMVYLDFVQEALPPAAEALLGVGSVIVTPEVASALGKRLSALRED